MADETTQVSVPALPDSPWKADLETRFPDPAQRVAVDEFLRGTVQPRITKLEQDYAQTGSARELWDAFNDDPAATYIALGEQLEQAGYFATAEGAAEAAADLVAEPSTAPAAEDPRLAELLAWKAEQDAKTAEAEQDAAYQADLAQALADPANADIDPVQIHKFVYLADGDIQGGIDRFRQDVAERDAATYERLGVTAEEFEQLVQERRGQAPATMGSSAGGAADVSTVPQLKGSEGLNSAIDRAVAASNAKAPPTI